MPGDQEVIASEIEAFINALQVVGNGEIANSAASCLRDCVKATMIQDKK